MKRLRNWLIFTLIVIIWGSNWAVMKSGLTLVGPLNFVMQRFLLASLALSPLLVYLRQEIPKDSGTWTKLLLFGIINTVSMLSTSIGLTYEKSGISAVLTYTQPLFVFCLAVPFLNEESTARRVVGILAGFIGVLVLYLGRILSSETFSQPLLFLLLGALFWAVATVYYKRFLRHVNAVVTNAIQFIVSAILLSIPVEAFEGFSFIMTATYVFMVLYMSVFASAIALTLWVYLLKEEEVTVVSASSFIIPMVALIFGWFFLQESIEPESILGFALTLTGVYLVNKRVPSHPER